MMMNNLKAYFFLFFSIILLSGCQTENGKDQHSVKDLVKYVDPYIGTGFHGHVFLGANVPFGAVQLGPTNITQGWDWCSGYHYSDSTLIGFSHTHLSGTGIGDLGDILFMPVTGDLNVKRGTITSPDSGYMAFYDHDDETVSPGYYAVDIERYGVRAELTTSQRVGFHKYTFPKNSNARVIVDLERGIGWDQPTETYIEKVSDSLVVGYRYSIGWAKDQRIYFAAVFSSPINEFGIYEEENRVGEKSHTGKRSKAAIQLDISDNSEVLVKVGISPVSTDNALENITAEIPHWDFEKTTSVARDAWNRELNKLQIETIDESDKRTFYSSLYHTMIAPSVFNDQNGDYRGADNKIHNDTTFTNLTTFSLWDTYRAAHPLFTLTQGGRVDDMINSMLNIYQQQGKLPIWHLMGNETNTMVGYSAIPVIADAYLKGFSGFDKDLAYRAMQGTAMLEERGIKFVKEKGFIPADSTVESVAMGLEYAISDWCVAQIAKERGEEDDYQYFSKRAKFYQNYFDTTINFMRGRVAEDQWRVPFDPFKSKHQNDDFCEGNSWQYSWLVPHDVKGLIELYGGENVFESKLDSTFLVEGDLGEEASGDITGLIGQYAHGNEPSHHIAYLYSYICKPWKTAEKVRYILDRLYNDSPSGLCGNEDVGQMSAWYVLSALGFYPVNPANGEFVFGSPIIQHATIHLANGNSFEIEVKGNSKDNIYIQGIELNGEVYDKSFISYHEIIKGGKMVIQMGYSPNESWGNKSEHRPNH